MNLKPFILIASAVVLIIVVHTACSQRQTPAQRPTVEAPKVVKIDSFWNNVPLDDILDQVAEAYHVKICNPLHLQGVSITGSGLNHDSLERICQVINIVEKGKVYVRYQGGVVFVSRTPLPDHFVPDRNEWPCCCTK